MGPVESVLSQIETEGPLGHDAVDAHSNLPDDDSVVFTHSATEKAAGITSVSPSEARSLTAFVA